MAQWIARWTSNPKVVGSSPTWGIFYDKFLDDIPRGIIQELVSLDNAHEIMCKGQ